MVFCFLDFQEIREGPKKTKYPVTDLRESKQHAQSESANPDKANELEAGKNNP